MSHPKVSIIIVNWNTKDYLEKCLTSIYETTKDTIFEIIVVDNASSDGSTEIIRSKFSHVTLIENKENSGFGAANNQGIKISKGKYILILNPDTIILPECLDRLVNFLDQHSDVGAIGPKILNPDGTVQLTCARNFPTPLTEFFAYSILFRKFLCNKIFGNYLMTYWDHNDEREVSALSGSCMMFGRKALDEVGLFDENFFMYGEDLDLCYRIKKGGWKIWFLPNAQIVHYGGQSSSQVPVQTFFFDRDSMHRFFLKHYGIISGITHKIIVLIYTSVIQIFYALSFVLGNYNKRISLKNKIKKTSETLMWALNLTKVKYGRKI